MGLAAAGYQRGQSADAGKSPGSGQGKETVMLTVNSSAFAQNTIIPTRYSCKGENFNPDLHISGSPEMAKSTVLIFDDPDAPMGTFTHWIVWNLPVDPDIPERGLPPGAVSGKNGAGGTGYIGPCPPSGMHRYFFRVFALDTELDLPSLADRDMLEQAMRGHVVAQGELMGLFAH